MPPPLLPTIRIDPAEVTAMPSRRPPMNGPRSVQVPKAVNPAGAAARAWAPEAPSDMEVNEVPAVGDSHRPARQLWPLAHRTPQPPQFAGSELTSPQVAVAASSLIGAGGEWVTMGTGSASSSRSLFFCAPAGPVQTTRIAIAVNEATVTNLRIDLRRFGIGASVWLGTLTASNERDRSTADGRQ
jgi:hypothetical protein